MTFFNVHMPSDCPRASNNVPKRSLHADDKAFFDNHNNTKQEIHKINVLSTPPKPQTVYIPKNPIDLEKEKEMAAGLKNIQKICWSTQHANDNENPYN